MTKRRLVKKEGCTGSSLAMYCIGVRVANDVAPVDRGGRRGEGETRGDGGVDEGLWKSRQVVDEILGTR